MTSPGSFKVGESIEFGGPRLVLIAGPCVIESEAHALMLAESIRDVALRYEVPFIFKASFDKANRSSLDAYRGPGLEAGLKILERVRATAGVPVTSDVHEPLQATAAGEVLDMLQVPAFLCRQTDLLLACGATGRPVNVKKGQFLAPSEMANVVTKLRSTQAAGVAVTERGSSFGYNNLVVDMRSLPTLAALGVPVVFDATHSVQLPGGKGTASGGDRRFIRPLARAAVAVGVNAVFAEVHDNPDKALSDGPNNLHLSDLAGLLEELLAIHETAQRLPPVSLDPTP